MKIPINLPTISWWNFTHTEITTLLQTGYESVTFWCLAVSLVVSMDFAERTASGSRRHSLCEK